MSEGTSLEDIESGNVSFTADSAVMSEILKDMNELTPEQPTYPPMPLPSSQPPPMPQPTYQPLPMALPPQSFEMPQHYQPIPDPPMSQPTYVPAPPAPPKKNAWSNLFDIMNDPLIVAILVGIVSLPAIHTWLAKHLKWAYQVGGALSWTGIVLQSIVAGLLFAGYKYASGNIHAI